MCHARGFMEIFRRRSENLQSYTRVVASRSVTSMDFGTGETAAAFSKVGMQYAAAM